MRLQQGNGSQNMLIIWMSASDLNKEKYCGEICV